MKGFLQRILQEIMKKNNTRNIRRLVDDLFVPSSNWPSVLYCKLTDFRKLSSALCHNSNNTQWWLGFPFFLRGETESVLRVISSSRNGSELKRPMAHKVCKRTKIHIRDYCKSYPTKDWCVSMVAKKVAAQTYCHSWGLLFLRGQTQSFWPKQL